ncbi:MAG TPA: GNAT family N-acetyltransferase [Draconibacterium sp.]|nr:GNAT family N-acetyltransferase [Draconibacterium sp.]
MNLEWIELQEIDYPLVKEIYDYYVVNTTVTFATGTISLTELKEAILIGHPKYKSFVINLNGAVCGYCYFSQYRKRAAYDRTAEVSVYLKPGLEGKGIGTQTLEKMQKIALQNGIAVLIGIITAENERSVLLFEKCGFEKCAHFRKVGEKFNRLLDVVAYQKILNE